MKTSTSIGLGILGIVATFVATFSGVYLAASVTRQQAEETKQQAYKALITVMDSDCKATLEQSHRSVDIVFESIAPAPGIMLSSLFQNSLLLDRMNPDRSVRLVTAIGEASQLSARLMRKISRLDMMPTVGERQPMDPRGLQFLNDLKKDRGAIEKTALLILETYSRQLDTLCGIIEEEMSELEP